MVGIILGIQEYNPPIRENHMEKQLEHDMDLEKIRFLLGGFMITARVFFGWVLHWGNPPPSMENCHLHDFRKP